MPLIAALEIYKELMGLLCLSSDLLWIYTHTITKIKAFGSFMANFFPRDGFLSLDNSKLCTSILIAFTSSWGPNVMVMTFSPKDKRTPSNDVVVANHADIVDSKDPNSGMPPKLTMEQMVGIGRDLI